MGTLAAQVAAPTLESWSQGQKLGVGGAEPHQARLGPLHHPGVLDESDPARDSATGCQLADQVAEARNATSPKRTRGLDDCC